MSGTSISKETASQQDIPDYAIEVEGLTKTYKPRGKAADEKKPVKALDSIDLKIPRGSLFGLLGPNGAGKSTFINILAGLVVKSSGQARIWGYDIIGNPRQARAAIGVVPQELNIDPFFTPYELLEVQAGLYGVPKSERRSDEILKLVGLYDKRKAYARALSGGMRRRLLIAKALVHNPPVLVLDEPTAGVDIELRRQLWDNVRMLNAQGTTVLLTTHYLEEAEQLCDRIAIINHGNLVANESKRTLLAQLDAKCMMVELSTRLEEVPEALRKFNTQLEQDDETGNSRLVITYKPSTTRAGEIVGALGASDLPIRDLSTVETDLEDIFLQITRDS